MRPSIGVSMLWITCPSTGVVAEKDGGFLHHHRVGEAEQGPSTGGKKEGVRHGIPRKLRIIPAIQCSEVLVGQVEMSRCSALQGPGYSYFQFRFQYVRELHQPLQTQQSFQTRTHNQEISRNLRQNPFVSFCHVFPISS